MKAGIFLPNNMVDNLQAAIDGRFKTASFHAAQGIICEKHLHIIDVLEKLQGLFCGEHMPSVPPSSPPFVAFNDFPSPHYGPPIHFNQQFQNQQQQPEYYPNVMEYSPYYTQPAPRQLNPACYPARSEDTFHNFQHPPASALYNPDTSNPHVGFGRDGDFRVQMPERNYNNDTDSSWSLDPVLSPSAVDLNPCTEAPPSPAWSSNSLSSYDEDFPPLPTAA